MCVCVWCVCGVCVCVCVCVCVRVCMCVCVLGGMKQFQSKGCGGNACPPTLILACVLHTRLSH